MWIVNKIIDAYYLIQNKSSWYINRIAFFFQYEQILNYFCMHLQAGVWKGVSLMI